ncbi:hypothetical protein [Streptomyces pini]|uniref:hypothetical protein n=1 Tax=Streptomyces pini TaxID=1520580 RepID=UPI000B85C870|nr:hypothetical protein [Streptomyces pini]
MWDAYNTRRTAPGGFGGPAATAGWALSERPASVIDRGSGCGQRWVVASDPDLEQTLVVAGHDIGGTGLRR